MTTTAERPLRSPMTDVALLSRTFQITERRPGQPLAQVDTLQVRKMRSLTQTRLHQSGLSRLADDAALVVSELVTNAVQHSHGRKITLTLALRDGHLDIRVHDGVPSRLPIASKPDAHAENGRGLWLVESIASQWHGSWGISDKGATTWCDLALEVS